MFSLSVLVLMMSSLAGVFQTYKLSQKHPGTCFLGLPQWFTSKESACKAGDSDLISGSGRSPGGGNVTPLQYYCLGNPMDR